MREIITEHNQEFRCLETYTYMNTNSIELILLRLQGHIKDLRLYPASMANKLSVCTGQSKLAAL